MTLHTTRAYLLQRAFRERSLAITSSGGKPSPAAVWREIFGEAGAGRRLDGKQRRAPERLVGLEKAIAAGQSAIVDLFAQTLKVLTPFERALLRAATAATAYQLGRHGNPKKTAAGAPVLPQEEFLNWFNLDYVAEIACGTEISSDIETSGAHSVLSFFSSFDAFMKRFQGPAATAQWNSATGRLRQLLNLAEWQAEDVVAAQLLQMPCNSLAYSIEGATGGDFFGIELAPPEVQALVRIAMLPSMGYPVTEPLRSAFKHWADGQSPSSRRPMPIDLVQLLAQEWVDSEMTADVNDLMGKSAFIRTALIHLLPDHDRVIERFPPSWVTTDTVLGISVFLGGSQTEVGKGLFLHFQRERQAGAPIAQTALVIGPSNTSCQSQWTLDEDAISEGSGAVASRTPARKRGRPKKVIEVVTA